MKRLFVAMFCLMLGTSVFAEELGSGDIQLIKSSGIQVYPEADFVNGSRDVGYRFATAKSPDEVRAWYKKQMPSWALFDNFDSWILYDGKPGAGMGELMTANQVSIKENKMLHEWFGIDKAMSTEIVIMIPE
jgi:hypothetical protein